MRTFVTWLEENDRRLRKVLAIYTSIVWGICVIASYILYTFTLDTIAILSLVTAQFATVMVAYMVTRADND